MCKGVDNRKKKEKRKGNTAVYISQMKKKIQSNQMFYLKPNKKYMAISVT